MNNNEWNLDEEDDIILEETEFCPACGGDAYEMGNLGILMWYRCQYCDMEFARNTEDA
ncbi:MAG TPA: hypothetical protein PK916_13325 [Bacteroidota bacterium]|nr:hypothetical protein [Bacteroidota bacterium]